MKIYNVLWRDRHTNVTATPFSDFRQAKEWARKQAEESNSRPEDLKEEDYFLYYIKYTSENDCLWITEHEVS